MTQRDRLMLMGIVLVAVLGGVWMMAVSPARKQATKATEEVTSARSQLAQAQTEAVEARSAQSRYHAAYASLASLGQAVPTTPEVPSLVYALDRASSNHHVQFNSITTSATGSTSSSSSSSSESSAQGAPFTQMPFTFVFAGDYHDLIHLLTQLERFTIQSPGGPVEVSGRLLTIQGITLGTASQSSGSAASTSAAQGQMTWSITASAYILAPASTPASPAPAGSAAQSSAAPAAPGSGGVTPTPAVVQSNG